ncbi:MAG TPA: tyrosine-type recombinase/integrase [Solirubrobacterales bacterium]|nr:tyrosine-type recombinase/integrase [Solirubrobacterales bacterium]
MISTTGPVTGNRMVTSAPSPRSTSGRLVGTSRTVVLRFLAEAFFPFLVGWTLSSGAGRRMAPFPQPHQLLSRRPRPDAYVRGAREVLADLRRREDTSPAALIIPNTEGCPYVRLQSAGKGSGTSAWRVLKEAMGHNVRWHDLRHLFAVRFLQHGVPMAVVSQGLGHSDINLTVKRYGRFAAETGEQFTWINILAQPVEALAEARKSRLEVAR